MDQATLSLLASLLAAIGGILVGRSTIKKQNAEAVSQATNAGYVSVQTFALLRSQVESMQTELITTQTELVDVKTELIKVKQENESLKDEVVKLKESNSRKDSRIAELERKLKNFMDPKPHKRRMP